MPPTSAQKSKSTENSSNAGSLNSEDTSTKAAAPKEKFLSTGLARSIFASVCMGAALYSCTELVHDRYHLVAPANSPNMIVYRLDRIAGTVWICAVQECNELKKPR